MDSTGNETLDRIQREIEEALRREEELRQKYNLLNNNNNNNNVPEPQPEARTNGLTPPSPEPAPPPRANGLDAPKAARLFAPHAASKGVMQKFLKMRGKLSLVAMRPAAEPQPAWAPEEVFEPARVTLEAGRPIRNGYVSAEEKMRRELLEFQRREAELRLERKKSQPDLMAALEREEAETTLKPARSMVMLYSTEDLTDEGSGPSSLRRQKSLAELCDASDEELESRRTHSLIMQFENLRGHS